MDFVPIIGCGLLGAGTVALLVPMILRVCKRSEVIRSRDFHHTHRAAVPRFGGLALAGAFIAVEFFMAVLLPEQRANIPGRVTIILGSLAMFAVGFWDDLQRLGAGPKLLFQVLIAVCVHYAGVGIDTFKVPFSGEIIALHGWGVILTVIWLVGITNLMNLIDGVDGLAGGIALMLMWLLVYAGVQNGTFVFLTAGMTGAIVAFLYYNFPPARVYMGDGGAYLLGFQIAAFSLASSHKGTIVAALLAPLFVLALPIVDTSLAIARRGFRGLPLFRPDRRHIHHRLLATGMSRRSVVIFLYVLTLLFLFMGFAVFWSRAQLFPVLLGMVFLVLLLGAGRLSRAREWLAVGRHLGDSFSLRQDIQYALSLATWLKHEGRRCGSLEKLFEDFVFAARRLGFASVELRSSSGDRVWSQEIGCGNLLCFRHKLRRGANSQLELRAPACLKVGQCATRVECSVQAGSACRATEYETYLCELVGELLAETWEKASARCNGRAPVAVPAPALRLTRAAAVLDSGLAAESGGKTLSLPRSSAAAQV